MIDFHSHILPQVDDGSSSIEESLSMLSWSFQQGVDLVVSTSHFYAFEEYPSSFLQRRNQAYEEIQNAILLSTDIYPKIILGAEVLYFPGISQAEDMEKMKIGSSDCILIEPPMAPWTERMLDEIEEMADNFHCVPVIAHVDRYMQILRDRTLIERVRERNFVVQVNAEYFLNPKTLKSALRHLQRGNIQVIGSDCHNLESRSPNLIHARKKARAFGVEKEFLQLHQNAVDLLFGRGE